MTKLMLLEKSRYPMKRIYSTVILSLIVSSIPFSGCAYKTYPTVQTFQETRYRTEYSNEPYTENKTIVSADTGEFELSSYFKWHTSNVSYYGYEIPDAASYDNVSLRFSIWRQLQPEPVVLRVFDVSDTGQIPSPEPLLSEELRQESVPDWYLLTGNASSEWLKLANSTINQARFLGGSEYKWS
jgi:hypothetical protein